ncbi:hypothetical protein [Mesorhizobium sp.]|nr:hypothetical protein [Mesorhizobium sp.]
MPTYAVLRDYGKVARATASICFAMVELELIDRERCVVERRIDRPGLLRC